MLAEWWHEVRYRLRALTRGAALDRDLDVEIDAHLEREAEVLQRHGLSPDEARRRAKLAFGGVQAVREQTRDARGVRLVEHVVQDTGYAWRRLRRSPALSLTVVSLLALTIGSATTVFSVVNAVLLRPLPYGDPDRIVMVWETRGQTTQGVVGRHEYPEWARSNRTFEAMSPLIYQGGVHLTDGGEPAALFGVRVASTFFPVMGVAPVMGRAFDAADDETGRGNVVVLSERLWRSRFGGDPGVIGRTIHLNERAVQIVGVMPASFGFPQGPAGIAPDIWMPTAENTEHQVGRHDLFVVGRLRPGVTAAQAQADLSGIATQLAQRYPNNSAGHGANVIALHEQLVKDVRSALLVLFGAVGFLLLIGCSNVASLLLARGATRQREVALRVALGATRPRLLRPLVIESLMLSVAGGACGILLAVASLAILRRFMPPGTVPVGVITLDRTVLTFATAISVVTGIVFGLAPAFQASRAVPTDALGQGGRWQAGGRTRVRRGLVIAQVALAVPLVLGAALMGRGLVALHAVDPGFVVKDILAVDVSLRGATYASPHRQRDFFEAVEGRVRTLPGVLGVGSVNNVPLEEARSGIGIEVEGKAEEPGQPTSAQYRVVTPGYFRTIGVAFVSGRDFSLSDARLALPLIRWSPQQPLPPDFDRPQPIPVAIVNDSMARQFWPDGAIGRRFKVLASPWITVVGVVRDMRTESLRRATGPEFYLTAAQEPQASMGLLVRTSGIPTDLAAAIRSSIAVVDPSVPIASMRTLEDVVDETFGRPRFLSALLGSFAAIALGLMAIGIYGLLAFAMAQRLPEIGVRLALGASRSQIRGLVLRDAGTMTVIGVGIGIGAGLALGRFLADQLYGVTPSDPTTLGLAMMTVMAIVGAACWLPVRRAGRVDPIVVLRHE